MKLCDCGGKWYRHGEAYGDGLRYRCSKCKKCITVRNGQIVSRKERMIKDWRHELATER